MVLGVEAESQQVYEEARSVLGSLVTRLIAIIHMILDHIVRLAKQVIAWASEHPLAFILLVTNVAILIS